MINKYNNIVIDIARQFAINLYIEEDRGEWYEGCYELHEYKGVYGGILEIFDRFISFDDILTMFANGFTAKSVLDYTDYAYDLHIEGKECRYNYYIYTRYMNNPEQYKKEEQESLKKSKKAVEKAKEELEKAIKRSKCDEAINNL